jgi:hypothetical protein
MTRQRIIDGLELLTQLLADGNSDERPLGWEPHEWAYLKGIASAEILRLRDRLVAHSE